ncbi:hypothetical protein GLOIN_2v1841584 [Rhizophagus irregularis DAOM 181602=DAOM 197198]|uniref:Uncharacterized protein n=1 Tax=Rhizophagus irregularis (strain DAOM 181602 / DAOM 197198 / MUCL 43194) TaxID=747089 RepID=A0A2P4PZ46_RHIID|nr:hypothetical protein GLOIN_2v1841584 [Rhizophagus irregularis DAOM 181602=DAOM 197198]POG70638.1 hypothetical protein GLOIN_2v1841584 [Rhizophagus irregularis DAOM 181602=DAOM 197198]|eukprot:XP_025177504.1 hypothetical protein GLOIN_2v1841584 [Rhizophagus irregularis DAOM 181602=DAOM 197198]
MCVGDLDIYKGVGDNAYTDFFYFTRTSRLPNFLIYSKLEKIWEVSMKAHCKNSHRSKFTLFLLSRTITRIVSSLTTVSGNIEFEDSEEFEESSIKESKGNEKNYIRISIRFSYTRIRLGHYCKSFAEEERFLLDITEEQESLIDEIISNEELKTYYIRLGNESCVVCKVLQMILKNIHNCGLIHRDFIMEIYLAISHNTDLGLCKSANVKTSQDCN